MSADLYARAHAEIDRLIAVEQAATPGKWRTHDTWLPHGGYAATVMSGQGDDIDLRAWLPTFSDESGTRARNVIADAALTVEARNIFSGMLAIARATLTDHAPHHGTCGHCDDSGCHSHQAWPCPEARQVLDMLAITDQ